MGRCLAPIIILLFALNLQAGPRSIAFGYHDSGTGFVTDRVTCMLKDRYGLMWFGTQIGLIRFDGMSSVVYAHSPRDPMSLSNNNVNTLFEDSSGNLWVGTSDGLDLINREHGVFTQLELEPDQPGGVRGRNVWAIAQEPGKLWIGADDGLHLLQDNQFTHLGKEQGLSDLMVTSLASDPAGFLWVGTNSGGLYRIDEGVLAPVFLRRKVAIQRLHVDHCGNLWVGTRKQGLARLSPNGEIRWFQHEEGRADSLAGNSITGIDSDYRGILWFGTSDGLSRFDSETGLFQHFRQGESKRGDLRSSSSGAIYCDWDGILWVATNFGGVDTLDLYNDHFINYEMDDKEIRTISRVVGDPNRLWVGTKYGGLALLSLEANEIRWFLPNRLIRSIYHQRPDTLWVGTDTGLVRLNPTRPEEAPINYFHGEYRVWRILPDGDDLWLGTGNGLVRFNSMNGESQLLGAEPGNDRRLNNSIVTSLVAGRDGVLWVGTYGGGLNRLDTHTGKVRHYTRESTGETGLSANDVTHLSRDRKGRLWVSTLSGGLILFDPEHEQFRAFSTHNGFPDNIIVAAMEDYSGRVWVSTSIGLVSLDLENNVYRLFDINNGVHWGSAVPGACLADEASGMLFFAGTGSVVAFRRNLIRPLKPSPILFTSFMKRGVEVRDLVHPNETLVLAQEDRSFSLELAVLDYRANARRRFAWQRMNVDDDWYYSSDERTVNYTRYLSYGGTAVLKAKATGSGALWSETSLTLEMAPPWWVEWSALLIVAGLSLLITLVYLLVSARERVRRRKLRELAQLAEQKRHLAEERAAIAERSREMEEEERRREEEHGRILREHLDQVSTEIANDLHDGPLGELHGVGFLLKNLENELKASREIPDLERVTNQMLPKICNTLRNFCGELLLPDFRAGLVTELDSYADVIENLYRGLKVVRELDDNDQDLSPELCAALYRIFRTTLKNVGKHAQASQVVIRFRRSFEFIELVVEDNGKGFTVPSAWDSFKDNKHYGMYMANYLAESVDGVFSVASIPGQGTCVRVHIPEK